MYSGTSHSVSFGGGQVGLSVLMGGSSAGQPAPMWKRLADGQVFVAGEAMTQFSLRVTNGLYEPILVIPAIDHRAVLEDKPASTDGKGMIIPGHGAYTFDGWRKDNATTLPFVFTLPDASVAAQAALPDTRPVTGVIGLALYRQRNVPVVRSYPSVLDSYEGFERGMTKGVAVASPRFAPSPVTDGQFERYMPSLTLVKVLYASEEALRAQGLLTMPEPEAFPQQPSRATSQSDA